MTPRVSVIMVSYFGRELVMACLARLAEHTPVPYEVIVVDSASPDGTGPWLAEHAPATVYQLAENLGFGAGCNVGVGHARGELLCFLNADVEVQPGWIEPLLAVLDANPDVAAVAPLLLNPDGTVQEAGSVIGGDGWCRAWTGAEAGLAREDLFPREVDYASGACLLMRRRAFWAVGGFSPEYRIGYFEDVDLALQLRSRGWQTWVQPASTVVHLRHGSSSSERAAELMRINRETFRRRWPEQLAGRAEVTSVDARPHRLWWLRDQVAPLRVLIIDDRVPQPDRGRGDPRTQAVLDAWLTALPGTRVTFLAASDDGAADRAPGLRARGVEVVWGVDPLRWARERVGLYDVIVAFRPHNFAALGEPISRLQPQAVRVYDSEALFHRRPEQHFDDAGDAPERRRLAIESRMLRRQEVAAFRWADVAVCVSEQEAGWARGVAAPATGLATGPATAPATKVPATEASATAPNTRVLVACYPVRIPDSVPGLESRAGVIFFGGFDGKPSTPNEFAVLELAGDVMPALRAAHPGLSLRVVGAEPSPAVLALQGAATEVVGKVPDPYPYLASARLKVVPLRYGAGVKIKFVDSMAAGLPFVTTPIGAEGLYLGWLAEYLVADSTAELVTQCDRLLRDDTLWSEVQQALLEICREHFSVDQFNRQMSAVLVECGIAPVAYPA